MDTNSLRGWPKAGARATRGAAAGGVAAGRGAVGLALMAALTAALGAWCMTSSARSEANRARDPAIAVQEEYDLAVARGTAEALALFIARHPDSRQAEAAAARLRDLKAREGSPRR